MRQKMLKKVICTSMCLTMLLVMGCSNSDKTTEEQLVTVTEEQTVDVTTEMIRTTEVVEEVTETTTAEVTTETTTEAVIIDISDQSPYVKYARADLSWNDLDETVFVCEGTELSLQIMVADGEGGTVFSYNSFEYPEAHVVFTMRPTEVSNNVITGGLNNINPDADIIYMGLYEENGVKWIDMYDTGIQQHTYYKEK